MNTRSDYDRVFNYLAAIDDIPLHTIDSAWVYRPSARVAHAVEMLDCDESDVHRMLRNGDR